MCIMVERILFVCHGNICRSPMAEFIAKDIASRRGMSDRFEFASCAISSEEIGNDIYPPVRKELAHRGVPFESRSARRFTDDDYAYYDRIFVMDDWNLDAMMYMTVDDPDDKVRKMLSVIGEDGDVSDPWYTGRFPETFDLLHGACSALIDSYRH